MAGHLILVVHGIGEQRPGETVDAVVAGAIADHERSQPDVPLRIETDVLDVPEYAFPPEDEDAASRSGLPRQMPHFPVHLRHVRPVGQPAAPPTTLADVYWADISPAPDGQITTILDLIRTLLSTGYLALENAKGLGSVASHLCVLLFFWAFFAGMSAINTHLVIGVVILFPLQSFFSLGALDNIWPFPIYNPAGPQQLVVINGLCTAGLGLFIKVRGAKTQLMAQFARGLMAVGMITVLYVGWRAIDPSAFPLALPLAILALGFGAGLNRARGRFGLLGRVLMGGAAVVILQAISFAVFPYLAFQAPETFSTVEVDHPAELDYLIDYIEVMIRLMALFWILALLLCVVVYLCWGFEAIFRPLEALDDGSEKQRRIYAPICSALILIWMVLASSFWVLVEYLVRGAGGSGAEAATRPLNVLFDAQLSEALGGMTIALIWFFILIAVTGIFAIIRHNLRDVLHEQRYFRARRLLLSLWFQYTFAFASFFIALVVAHLTIVEISQGTIAHPMMTNAIWMLAQFEEAASVMLLILGLFIYNFFRPVSGILGIVRDITVYATTTRRDGFFENRPEIFANRMRIERRLERVLGLLWRTGAYDRVTIVSHSLGTVVATRCLERILASEAAPPPQAPLDLPKTIALITMGSPVTHIYRRYFPVHFEIGPAMLSPRITWTNIFRSDDFVGTRISGLNRTLANFVVPAAGHSGYFTDAEVWEILRLEAKLTLA
ncbi:MAG: hypothetical protein AAGC82_02560 [Pseudomonadota bacterium]